MTTKEFLRLKARKKGIKISKIMHVLGLKERHQLSKRYNKIIKFTAREVYILKDLLELSDAEIKEYLIAWEDKKCN